MEDPPEDNDSGVLTGWTMISSQGDIVHDDGESETSESSIEVVAMDENGDVAYHISKIDKDGMEVSEIPEILPDTPVTAGNSSCSSEDCSSSFIDPGSQNQLSYTKQELEYTEDSETQSGCYVLTGIKSMLSPSAEIDEECAPIFQEEHKNLSSSNTSVDGTKAPLKKEIAFEDTLCKEVWSRNQESTSVEVQMSQRKEEAGKVSKDPEENEYPVGECCVDLSKQSKPDEDHDLSDSEEQLKHMFSSSGDVEEEVQLGAVKEVPEASFGPKNQNESDTDSDYVCLDQENPEQDPDVLCEEAIEERDEGMMVPLNVSRMNSSIGPDFNFMRDDDGGRRNPSENDEDDRDEDTESSTEEGIDDRIESEQSEAGSLPHNNDVGDLSSISDFGELPLVAGNVARNYKHEPNNHVTMVLNMTLVLAAMLTMGMSLGIIMATDLEIEEWQRAYEVQAQKVKTLESQRQTLEILLNQYKKEVQETNTRLQLEAHKQKLLETLKEQVLNEDNSLQDIAENFQGLLLEFSKCSSSQFQDSKSCYNIVTPYLNKLKKGFADYAEKYPTQRKTIEAPDQKKPARQKLVNEIILPSQNDHQREGTHETDETEKLSLPVDVEEEESAFPINQIHDILIPVSFHESKEDTLNKKSNLGKRKSVMIELDIKQLQQSLTREQERAVHWQQLYLAERRNRERERENEEWEDERDRERWEQEREHADRMECLQKLMSTNLTTLTQHMLSWNISVFDDFANLSMLMSTVAELKQSVVSSVQKVWEEAEEIFESVQKSTNKRDYDEHKKEKWDSSLLNKEVLMNHFNRLIVDIKKEVDEALKEDGDNLEDTKSKTKEEWASKRKHSHFKKCKKQGKKWGKKEKKHGKVFAMIKKTRKSVRAAGKKFFSFLGDVQDAWENKHKWMSRFGSYFTTKPMKKSPEESFEEICTQFNKEWVITDLKGKKNININHECMSWVRSEWHNEIIENPCKVFGEYSRECNVKRPDLKGELEQISKQFEQLLNKQVISKDVHLSNDKLKSNALALKTEFTEFLKHWGSTHLLLKPDIIWAECQKQWWAMTYASSYKKIRSEYFRDNQCHHVFLQTYSLKDDNKAFISLLKPNRNDELLHSYAVRENIVVNDGSKESGIGNEDDLMSSFKNINSQSDKNLFVDFNETTHPTSQRSFDSNSWYLNHVRHRLEIRRKKEKSGVFTPYDKKDMSLKMKRAKLELSGEWIFKKSDNREYQRIQEHRSDWLFDRARGRRSLSDSFGSDHNSLYGHIEEDDKTAPNWFLDKGIGREKLRKLDQQADWVFERTHYREKHHRQKYDNDYDGYWLKGENCYKGKHACKYEKHSKHRLNDNHNHESKKKKDKFHGHFKHFKVNS